MLYFRVLELEFRDKEDIRGRMLEFGHVQNKDCGFMDRTAASQIQRSNVNKKRNAMSHS